MNNSPTRMAAMCLRSVLLEHSIAGTWAMDPVMGPRTLTLGIRLARTADLDRVIALDDAVAMRAGLKHVRMYRDRSVVVAEFEMPQAVWKPVRLDQVAQSAGRLAMGIDTRGNTVSIDLGEQHTSQLLIVGASGCGKTTLLSTLLYQLVQVRQKRVHVIDSKSELTPFYGIAESVHTNQASATNHLAEIASDLPSHRNSVIAVDEIAALIYENAKAATALGLITSQGRSLGINLVAGTQKVSKQVLGNEMIISNTARIVGRVVNASDSVLASGQAGMNAHRLSGYGDFLLVQGVEAQRFIAAQAGDVLKSLPAPTAPLQTDEIDASGTDDYQEFYLVGKLIAASVDRDISVSTVKAHVGGCGTDRARRLRDEALAVLRGIADGDGVVRMVQDG